MSESPSYTHDFGEAALKQIKHRDGLIARYEELVKMYDCAMQDWQAELTAKEDKLSNHSSEVKRLKEDLRQSNKNLMDCEEKNRMLESKLGLITSELYEKGRVIQVLHAQQDDLFQRRAALEEDNKSLRLRIDRYIQDLMNAANAFGPEMSGRLNAWECVLSAIKLLKPEGGSQ